MQSGKYFHILFPLFCPDGGCSMSETPGNIYQSTRCHIAGERNLLLLLAHCLLFAWFAFWPRKWRQCITPKRWYNSTGLHVFTFKDIVLFVSHHYENLISNAFCVEEVVSPRCRASQAADINSPIPLPQNSSAVCSVNQWQSLSKMLHALLMPVSIYRKFRYAHKTLVTPRCRFVWY